MNPSSQTLLDQVNSSIKRRLVYVIPQLVIVVTWLCFFFYSQHADEIALTWKSLARLAVEAVDFGAGWVVLSISSAWWSHTFILAEQNRLLDDLAPKSNLPLSCAVAASDRIRRCTKVSLYALGACYLPIAAIAGLSVYATGFHGELSITFAFGVASLAAAMAALSHEDDDRHSRDLLSGYLRKQGAIELGEMTVTQLAHKLQGRAELDVPHLVDEYVERVAWRCAKVRERSS